MDAEGRFNVIHYDSNKFRLIFRSVIAAEVQALFLGNDYAFLVRNLSEELLDPFLTLEATIDIRMLINVVSKEAQTTERRPKIDVFGLRQIYDSGELNRVLWISGTTTLPTR